MRTTASEAAVRYDFVVIGGGIVGLATALALGERYAGAGILVLEKEGRWAAHQTGRNSGVIHSGIYYRPGSLKAELTPRGNRALVEFCRHHRIAHDVCGKVIVATTSAELPRLEELHRRGIANGLAVTRLAPDELREIEPHVRGIAALHVPSAGIVDFRHVAEKFAELVRQRGGDLRLATTARAIVEDERGVLVETNGPSFRGQVLVNCAGLHSDRVARLAGIRPTTRIVPFRGEYFELRPERRHLVKDLIYPVPDPALPFLGVHLTRMIDGGVHAGPNAVLALRREGYRKGDLDLRDLVDVLGYRGFRQLLRRHWRAGAREMARSFSKRLFTRELQRLLPEIRAEDLMATTAGVRAQAVGRDGGLIDDFRIVTERRTVHVLNAPSPAATACIPIGRAIAAAISQDLVSPVFPVAGSPGVGGAQHLDMVPGTGRVPSST